MDKNKRLAVWLPVIIAFSVALGIFVGNHYLRLTQGKRHIYSSGNKINAILDIIDEQYVDTVNMKQLVEDAIPKVFNELDPHSVYIPAKDAQRVNEDLEGSFSGIGVSFNMQTDTILVINVIPGGPSEKAGLKPFDRIITINDSLYAGNKSDQEVIMKTLRGAKNSTVRLGVKRKNEPELLYFDVTRGDVPVNSIDVSYEVSKGIGYIKVSKFGRTTYNEFITAIAKLKQAGCTSFVIDLRGNTGGYMDAAINMVNEFMPEGRLIVYTEGKAFPRKDVYTNGTGTCQDAPIVVLTDEFSASASEIFSGAIQDNDRGLIIGRRTFGKGLVQSPIQLSDGSEIRLTIARYYTPSGRCIQKKYELGKDNEYEQDIYQRFMHGEFDSADSIKLNNNEKYETVMGRTVYGGGGIMPDIFIRRDFLLLQRSQFRHVEPVRTRIFGSQLRQVVLFQDLPGFVQIPATTTAPFRFHQLCGCERDQETSEPDQHIEQADRETAPSLHRPQLLRRRRLLSYIPERRRHAETCRQSPERREIIPDTGEQKQYARWNCTKPNKRFEKIWPP